MRKQKEIFEISFEQGRFNPGKTIQPDLFYCIWLREKEGDEAVMRPEGYQGLSIEETLKACDSSERSWILSDTSMEQPSCFKGNRWITVINNC